MQRNGLPILLLLVFLAALVLTGWSPKDRFTWWLEVAPAIVGVAALVATYWLCRLTALTYVLILIHAAILMIGGHYTYAEVPAGRWVSELLGWTRNHYDRLGHIAQGFVPAILVREVLLRGSPLGREGRPASRGWLNFLVVCVCMCVSAIYEVAEMGAAVATGDRAEAFLGLQGDHWDTQTDMLLAFVGAIAGLLVFGRIHDRAIRAVLVREGIAQTRLRSG